MKLYLIPCPIAEGSNHYLSAATPEIILGIKYYLVENERTARRFISSLGTGCNVRDLVFYTLDKKTKPKAVAEYFQEIPQKADVGVISEAGSPGIADPGAVAVAYAHDNDIEVVPIPGPSSIFLALAGSGFSGQNFAFHGYLAIDQDKRKKHLKNLEGISEKFKQTQLFMETPYRNNSLLNDLLSVCEPDTKLCIACNLTAEDQFIKSQTVNLWKKSLPDLHKKPTIFLIAAYQL